MTLEPINSSIFAQNPHRHVYHPPPHVCNSTPSSHRLYPIYLGEQARIIYLCYDEMELADQGITGEGRSLTERDLWVQKGKEALVPDFVPTRM